ncbi:DUF523 and DUF1722 domain-containing protein [Ectobacillus sp. JY-23]|uniref:YbgA family protein n=1 Tax=Ectobacillus sp. JY-23 TaxID=2933872 RepID=UPI001FF11117|nr:DUF523 and DUF1722 domain-containing protein [Ectobacillus sp. JY-23]UOY92955.1 DUF523 and DUF1722 domain-containing protein [Ectobacillus sp. JY-23]
MRTFTKPKVIVSKCLEFDACRYNGDVISDIVVKSLMPHVHFIPVCPEVEIGLGTPRETIRIVEEGGILKLVQPSTGEDVTEAMMSFSAHYLSSIEADGFILKSRSPSCGTRDVKIYAGGKIPAGKGSGLFGGAVLERFSHLAVEEEGRLRNFTIREHFFTKLFTIAAFKALKHEPNMKKLVKFHSDNKYLFMAYNQTKLKEIGRIVANHEQFSVSEVFVAYEKGLYDMFQRAARYTSHVNVCQHIFGYFKDKLRKEEKEHFLLLLDKYSKKKIPLSSILALLRSWTIRFEEQYLEQQTYFEPYPEDLIDISDSGKGRDY